MNIAPLFKTAVLSVLAIALTSCKDPNEPSAYLDTPTPDWAKKVNVVKVSKHSAIIRNSEGMEIRVERTGTDIGNGLIATRDQYDLYVQDEDGIKCNWNAAEMLEWSRKPNPAYKEYHANKNKPAINNPQP